MHQLDAKTDEADCPVAQIMGLPTARGDRAEINENVGDFAEAGLFEARIERARCEDQAVATVL